MTNENIIKQLKRLIPSLQYADDVNAVKGAIQALSQEPTKEEKALLKKWRDNRGVSMEEFEDAMNALQEPCDAISRDAVRKLRKYVWVGGTATVSLDDIDELPSVTPKSIECEDAISRDAVIRLIRNENSALNDIFVTHGAGEKLSKQINELPSVTQKLGKCKNCKYFEYDSVAKVDGVPLIVAHEICSRWGDGCKTREEGYCFLFEPQESEVRNDKRL